MAVTVGPALWSLTWEQSATTHCEIFAWIFCQFFLDGSYKSHPPVEVKARQLVGSILIHSVNVVPQALHRDLSTRCGQSLIPNAKCLGKHGKTLPFSSHFWIFLGKTNGKTMIQTTNTGLIGKTHRTFECGNGRLLGQKRTGTSWPGCSEKRLHPQ